MRGPLTSATVTDTTDAVGPAAYRPTGFDPQQLGFTPRKPVPWLGPVLLAVTGTRVALAEQFGAYLDKRELQYPFPQVIHDHDTGGYFHRAIVIRVPSPGRDDSSKSWERRRAPLRPSPRPLPVV